MSQPGWYPDPAGRPGHVRYWNGGSWSAETTSSSSEPPEMGPPGGPGRDRGRRPAWIWAVLALALAVVIIAGVLIVRNLGVAPPSTAPAPLPSSSVSGGDDRTPDVPAPTNSAPPTTQPEPTPSAEPSSAAPTPTPPPTGSGPPCPEGDPASRNQHPSNGRVYGGELSFAALPPSDYTANPLRGFTFAYDVAGQSPIPGRDWIGLMGVGALRVDGFESGPRAAAETVLQCFLPTAYVGSPVSDRNDLRSRRVTIGTAKGWAIRTEVRTPDDPYRAGRVIEVIVLDNGAPEALSFFLGMVASGDDERIALLDQTVRSLQIS